MIMLFTLAGQYATHNKKPYFYLSGRVFIHFA